MGPKVSNHGMTKIDFTVDVDEEDLLVQYLRYDSDYNLAVCIQCEHALPREWIAPHFKNSHKLSVLNSLSCKV